MPYMNKNKHTNKVYFLEHKKHLETNKKPKPKPNNNKTLYFRYPYFKISIIEDHIADT